MYHSIRWRLILSYTALTLLTILLVGIVSLNLVSRYMADREYETLTLNAEAVVRMARPLLSRPRQNIRLQQLAITSGFLTNTDLKILDSEQRVLAFSQVRPTGTDLASAVMSLLNELSPSAKAAIEEGLISPVIVISGPGFSRGMFALDLDGENLKANGASAISVERRPGLLGDRLIFAEPAGGTSTDRETAPTMLLSQRNRLSRRIWRFVFGDAQESAQVSAAGPTVKLPIHLNEQVAGYVLMTNRYPLFAEPLLAIQRSLMVAGLGAILVAILLGFLISRSLTAPLMALEGATQRMEEGDLTVRAPETFGEIGDVSRRFNRMAARLQATFADLAAERDALRRFIADASHELRTPLTALRQFVEILQGQAGSEPETRSEFLAESQRQLERLQWITGHLLDLSRLDGGVASLDVARHDAATLLESALSPFRSLAEQKGIDLPLDIADGLEEIYCDMASLEMALANLLDNALKYTPSGGVVKVAAAEEGNMTVLSVADSGPGIQPSDRERIFERFYRGEDNDTLPGAGLGLAIVKSAVEAHGGTVRVESEAGAKFTIEIPTATSPPNAEGNGTGMPA